MTDLLSAAPWRARIARLLAALARRHDDADDAHETDLSPVDEPDDDGPADEDAMYSRPVDGAA